ncbi:hypothetical protein V5H58_05425 [Helicobacter pylori]
MNAKKKGKDPKEAIKHTAIATLKGGVRSYGIASVGSLLVDMMQNNANQVIQSFGKSSLPVMIVGVAVGSCEVLIKYFRGKINSVECLEQLGEKNTNFLSGIAMSGIGQLAIPIPVVGALIGGFVGTTMSKTFYDISLKTLKEAKEVHQRRIEIEKECREGIRQLEMYRNQFKEVFERYFHGTIKFFNESFDELERALYAGDADLAIGGMLAAYGAYTGVGMLASTAGGVAIAELSGVAATNATLAWLGGGVLSVGGFGMVGGMAVLGGLVAGPALAILGAMSTDEMKEKLEKAKAYYSQVEKAVKKADAIIDQFQAIEKMAKLFTNKKADAIIDQFQAIEKMAKLFTKQITKCDALLFSLSQDAIATMKKHNYDISRYNQKEKDQLCVTVSTLMTLSAFLKVPIIDKHQKLQEKVQMALEIMKGQMDSLESGHYDAKMIQSRQQDLENLFKNGSPGGLKDKGL